MHATSDGVVVACHDSTLKRVAGERLRVGTLDWADVANVNVGGAPLPRLTELLDTFPDVNFNIDPKSDAAVRPLVDLLQQRGELHRVCVASFSDRRLRWVRTALGPQVCTAAGPREIGRRSARWHAPSRSRFPGVDVLQIPRLLTRRRVRPQGRTADLLTGAQRVGLPVHVWTVNDEREMADLVAHGVDGVMSDDVDALTRVFQAHGWQPAT